MSEGATTPVLLDVDPGVDDAMALALVVASPEIDLIGVTTVAGNVPRDLATRNAITVLDFLGAHTVPVYAGMSAPLGRAHVDAIHVHGADGLGGARFGREKRGPEELTAPEFIVQTARRLAGNVTFVFVGPLTNLAVALLLEPELPSMVRRTVIMGGAFSVPGNTSPSAEFNIAVDPEAAHIVASSNLRATWVGLDVTHSVVLTRDHWERLGDLDGRAATLVREVCRGNFDDRQNESFYLHDPLAIGVVLEPGLVETAESAIAIDTSMRASVGKSRMVVDDHAFQHDVCRRVDSMTFQRLFAARLGLPIAEDGTDQGQ